MRIKTFEVKELHGLIDASLDFHSDLTVIVGRNGSGKTSVLELISNLLRLDFDALRSTRLTEATLDLEDTQYPNSQIKVSTVNGARVLSLKVGTLEPVALQIDRPALSSFFFDSDSVAGPVYTTSNTIVPIAGASLSIPPNVTFSSFGSSFAPSPWDEAAKALGQNTHLTFVRLDRTILAIDPEGGVSLDQGISSKRARATRTPGSGTPKDPIEDVTRVTRRKYLDYRRQIQEIQHSALLDMFRLHFAPFDADLTASGLSEKVLRTQLERLKSQVQGSQLVADRPELLKAAQLFFEQFEQLLRRAFQKTTDRPKGGRRTIAEETLEIMLTFKREQIENLFQIFGRERAGTTSAFANIERYLTEARRYLKESGKDLAFSEDTYELGFTIPSLQVPANLGQGSVPTVRPLRELSSGERQIMIVLTFLSFLAGSNSIFVIDEPELSLHIRWQSYLIDSLRNLRPVGCQIIVATHAPEIAGRAREFSRILKPSYLPDGANTSDSV